MWGFAVGLFLIAINPESLQLTGVYGLVQGVTVLLLSPLVGDWVDITARLRGMLMAIMITIVGLLAANIHRLKSECHEDI